MKKIRSATFTILASTVLSTVDNPAQAQTTPPQSGGDSGAQIQNVTITGSRIVGARSQEALPVTVIDSTQISAVGSVSGDDLFRSLPQAGDVNFQEARTTGNLNDARGDNASINLRGVGTGNTLVLVNDRRLILTPGAQTENLVPVQTANTNSLPVGAVGRIEVLRDGAAALYGSDAVAGVVNVITDNKFKGVKLQGRYGSAKGTEEKTGAIKAGMDTEGGGNIQMFASYMNRSALMASERAFSSSENHMPTMVGTDWETDTGFDNRSTSSPWGSFTAVNAAGATATVRQGANTLTSSGAFHIEPTSNTAGGCSSSVINGNLCLRSGGITGTADRPLRYDENPDRSIRGGLDRFNGFASFRQPIGDNEMFGEANYYHAKLDGQREQSAPISSAVITIPASNYWNPFGPSTSPNRLPNLTGVPAEGLPIRITSYRPVDTGPRTFTVSDNMARGLLGIRGDLGKFKWESAVSYARARTDDNTHNAISNTLFQRQLALNTPDAYNPFNGGTQGDYSLGDGTPNPASSVKPFLVEVHRISETSLATWDARFSTPKLFNLKSGDVGLAAGVEWRRETYSDNRDARLDGTTKYTDSVTGKTYDTDVMGASASPDVSAHRSVIGAYAELAVPLVSPEMAVPLINSLDLQIAGRAEHYSDFGSVTKPKVAALWEVMRGVRMRASWSQSFRAPNLPQFYSDGTSVSNTRTDWAACRLNAVTCAGTSTLEVRSGNNQLKPESSENMTAGFALQPFKWMSATFDFWQLKSDGVIGILGGQNQLLYDYYLRLNGSSNPNVVRQAPVGTQVIGTVDRVNDNYFNLGPRTMRGWDATANFDSGTTTAGRFRFGASVAKLVKFYQSPSDVQQQLMDANNAGKLGTGIAITQAGDLIGQGANPRWRVSGNLTWNQGPVTVGMNVNSVGSYYDTGSALVNGQYYKVPRWTTANAYAELRMAKDGTWLGGTDFRIGARNLFDKAPPITSSNYGFNGALHDAIGRFIYVELSRTL
ncbi:TonB-dependent receptor domain-containing protein [Massilia sp. TS11]|uniref:TonB-dependent receptor domain-containing protein n=1 Tax=Massilia sp. TS11 TaxID=2908003 RepID=UPI001EDAA183|nr:TonB-dependent receptor [Massilia sp. TS11]MCG2586836.1 TonB-dependent receptor [Massilia sp. TS11]